MNATHEPKTTARPRQTAGNNAFLRECRRAYNDAFYKRCLAFVNDPALTVAEGEAAARAWLATK